MQASKLSIVQTGEPVLRQKARLVSREELGTASLQRLIEQMRDTMRNAPGIGLAAPQVAVPLQLAVIEDSADLLAAMPPERLAQHDRRPVPFHVIVNPVLTLEGDSVEFFEGCLSIAGYVALVPRAARVRVDCWNERGEEVAIQAEGWYARILQHEIDHLNGTLYIDRMHSRSFTTVDHHKRYWDRLTIEELRRTLLIP